MKAFCSIAPSALAHNIGRHIGSALHSIPKPHIDSRLAAEALRRARRGLGGIARHLTRAVVPAPATVVQGEVPAHTQLIRALRDLAQLTGTPPFEKGMHPGMRITSIPELASNLRDSEKDNLVRIGEALDKLARLSAQLHQQLDQVDEETGQNGLSVKELLTTMREIRDIASAISGYAAKTYDGYSQHLSTWMTKLRQDNERLMAEVSSAPRQSFMPTNEEKDYERQEAPRDVAQRAIKRTPSNATYASRKVLNPLQTEKEDSEEPQRSEMAFDFGSIRQLKDGGADNFIEGFMERINPLVAAAANHRGQASQHEPGSDTWCHSVAALINTLHRVQDSLEAHSKYYEDHKGTNHDLIVWFSDKLNEVVGEGNRWVVEVGRFPEGFKKLGYDLG